MRRFACSSTLNILFGFWWELIGHYVRRGTSFLYNLLIELIIERSDMMLAVPHTDKPPWCVLLLNRLFLYISKKLMVTVVAKYPVLSEYLAL